MASPARTYPNFLTDKEGATQGLRDALALFDAIEKGDIKTVSLVDEASRRKQGSLFRQHVLNRARKHCSAINRKRATLHAIMRDRLPTAEDARAFLGPGKALLAGPHGSFKAAPFELLAVDGKRREVRTRAFTELLLHGGTEGSEKPRKVSPALCLSPLPRPANLDAAVGVTFVVDWLAPDNGRAIVALTLTDIDVRDLDDAVDKTPGGLACMVSPATRSALVTALGGKKMAKGPFCLFEPQLLWPPRTRRQLDSLFHYQTALGSK